MIVAIKNYGLFFGSVHDYFIAVVVLVLVFIFVLVHLLVFLPGFLT